MNRVEIPLFHFRPHDTTLDALNTWFSLLYLLCRTLLVSLSAAQIHDESQKLANIIRAIPYNAFDDEVCILLTVFYFI